MNLQNTQTLGNLMRAFVGESLARNRYEFAAQEAERQKLPVIAAVFRYTADQEKEHAEIFADYLREAGADDLELSAGFPVDSSADLRGLLTAAVRSETREEREIYPAFAAVARGEGFEAIARRFDLIAGVEKCHAGRFEAFRKLLEENQLFVSEAARGWICLNCGHEFKAKAAPRVCPVCGKEGHFIRVEMSPYSYQ